jgi:hypothetical protein
MSIADQFKAKFDNLSEAEKIRIADYIIDLYKSLKVVTIYTPTTDELNGLENEDLAELLKDSKIGLHDGVPYEITIKFPDGSSVSIGKNGQCAILPLK